MVPKDAAGFTETLLFLEKQLHQVLMHVFIGRIYNLSY